MATESMIVLRSSLDEIPRLRGMLERFCARQRLPAGLAAKLLLVIDEIHTNVVSYGYPEPSQHAVYVAVSQSGPLLTLIYDDDAAPFHPNAAPDPKVDAPISERRVGGLGIHIVHSIMDEVRYIRIGQRNRYVMTLRLDDADKF